MIRRDVKVRMSVGKEATPIAMLVQTASQFDSKTIIKKGDKAINAKSIMGMMSLGLFEGDEFVVEVEGDDEEMAAAAIEKYLLEGK